MTIARLAAVAALSLLASLAASSAQVLPAPAPAKSDGAIRLRSTASIWLSDATPEERNSSAGRFGIFKLKSIQEVAAVRFDAAPVKGRMIRSARLFLHEAGPTQLRYLRVSTVSQDWTAGSSRQPYGPASGSTYLWADASLARPWSFPDSEFADVVMGMGHSITTYGERKRETNDWISVPLTPELVYALATGQTDGLAIAEGGTPDFFNNFVHSAEAGLHAPFIDVEVGERLQDDPAGPRVTATPAPAHAHRSTGAIRVEIQPDPSVFAWNVQLDGTSVPRWQIPYPPDVARTGLEQEQIRSGRTARPGPVVFHLDTLEPDRAYTIGVAAVARSGAVSPAVQLLVRSSPASVPLSLGALVPPTGTAEPIRGDTRFTVVPVPGLIKISPETGAAIASGVAGGVSPNAVWDGHAVRLFGARGEYVSYQLVIDRTATTVPLTGLTVAPSELRGRGGAIGLANVELYKDWYARNSHGEWQPSYLLPWKPDRALDIPDRQRGIDRQRNQSMYVDVYIPKGASAGTYTGTVVVTAAGGAVSLPVELEVYDFALPDTLSFWPELNAYAVPSDALAFHRLAHQHRLVFNPWVIAPALEGAGKDVRVRWNEYDALAGPLLSGEAFRGNRRVGVPTPAMYLPFIDSWPTPLSPETYRYTGHWPARGESPTALVEHYLTAPYIGDGLSESYKDAFLSVQRQFVEHFTAKGWNRTEMQLFFGGKNTHRLSYGTNMWWTTDEPYHWDDWLALQFFDNLWATGRRALGAAPRIWSVRADLSRPMWTGRTLDGITDNAYWGGFADVRSYRRAAWLSEHTGLGIRAYGGVSPSTARNIETVSTLLQSWMHGANAFLPWQTVGNDASLDTNDNADGYSLLVPGTRFGVPVVGDMRIKALRDGEQIIEYLAILTDRLRLTREQVSAMLDDALHLSARRTAGAAADDAEAARFSGFEEWQLSAVRRRLAELIVGAQH